MKTTGHFIQYNFTFASRSDKLTNLKFPETFRSEQFSMETKYSQQKTRFFCAFRLLN